MWYDSNITKAHGEFTHERQGKAHRRRRPGASLGFLYTAASPAARGCPVKLASSGGEVLVVSSTVDAGITVWDLGSGLEIAHLKSCASPRNALACVGRSFIVASQVSKQGSSSAGGAIFIWAWNKVQPEFKSYPVEPIGPLACTSDGSYIAGGGLSGRIYVWEIATGRLLRVWTAHYKSVTSLLFSDDESLLISGSDDGFVNVWPLLRVLDLCEDGGTQGKMQVQYLYTWSAHTLGVTGLYCGCGGSSAVVVSCSLDTLCKVWSLALGCLLRTIKFPTAINAVILDPGEYSLYAGSTDGRIFVTALNFGVPSSSGVVTDGISYLVGHSGAVTALAFSMDGHSLASASEDCTVCLWDTASCQTLRIFKHNKGPLSSLLLVPRPSSLQQGSLVDPQGSLTNRRLKSLAIAPLCKYVAADSAPQDLSSYKGPIVSLLSECSTDEAEFDQFTYSLRAMDHQIREFEQQGSTAAMQLELERLRSDRRRALIMIQQWQQVHQDLYYFCVEELMGGNRDKEGEDDNGKERERDREKGKKGRSKVATKPR